MTIQMVFEELRFVWELLAGECLFLFPFAKRKKGFFILAIFGTVCFSLLSMGRFFLLNIASKLTLPFISLIFTCWYIVLALLITLFLCCCFQLTISDALYIGIAGYSAQHIAYVLIHELLARVLLPDLPGHFFLYVVVSLCSCVLIFFFFFRSFSPYLRQCNGTMFSNSPSIIAAHVLLLTVLMLCTFSCQRIFELIDGYQLLGVVIGLMVCLLMLGLLYSSLRGIRTRQERNVIEQMLRDNANHYTITREMVECINRTCHDLKHSLNVLKTVSEDERQSYIEEAQRNIERYHQMVQTDNEVLNTILAEKSLYCDHHQIRLSCAVDCASLDFMSVPDLYTLLGNAIDNAIECVEHFEESERRIISLTICKQNAFICIQTNNYYDEEPKMEDGLPQTTKSDKARHGFGLKSIRYLAEKYGGRTCISLQDHIFILQIMIPLS